MKELNEINLKHLYSNEKAVSEVIGAVLVLTIVVAFLGFLQVYSVPVSDKEVENSHFNKVTNDLLDMKSILYAGAVYDLPASTVFHTSLDYPGRMFLLNPPKPSVTFTTRYDKQVTITYDGITEHVNSCTFSIEEKYNFITAPRLVMEHGMIIGDTGAANYSIDKPLLKDNNMNLLLLKCDNTSMVTGSSVSYNIYPTESNNITVNNATLSFSTDYPALWNEYLATIGANRTISGNIVTVNYPNSTKIRVISTSISTPSNLVLLPVTTPVQDNTPPASVINLINVTYLPLYINWTWIDPENADFDHVQVYIDGVLKGNVGKGVQSYNASYFKPNSTHTISMRTVDVAGNVNASWVNSTASTFDIFTSVFGFLNLTGTVTDFSKGQNATDKGASAIFTESLIGDTPNLHNYTYVTGNIIKNGTISNFSNMQSGTDLGAFSNLTEEAVAISASTQYKWYFNSTNESWVFRYSGVIATGGLNTGDGLPAQSLFSRISSSAPQLETSYTSWQSPNFTWTGGMPDMAVLDFCFKVVNDAKQGTNDYAVFLIDPDGSKNQIYQTTSFFGVTSWYNLSNNPINAAYFTKPGNYSILLNATSQVRKDPTNKPGTVEILWDNPAIKLVTTTYIMNITTNTTNIPVDTSYYLEINYSRDSNEPGYDVYVFNGTAWNLKGSLTSLEWSIANFALSSSEVINGNVNVRYIDRTPAGTRKGNLFIDYQRIHGNTLALPVAYSLNVNTDTTSIPDATREQILQLRYNVSNDSFVLQIWNGSVWNNRTTLNDTIMSYRNITLLHDELLPDGTLGGNIGAINTYNVLVRYLDMNASIMQQGKLYLDYQRVYTT